MGRRRSHLGPIHLVYALFVFTSAVAAQDDNPFNCLIRTAGLAYDLTPLAGEHTTSRTRDTPPSAMVDTVRFNLCADLEAQGDVAESDQCPSGTRACLTKTNSKNGHSDRIVAVIPLAQSASLEPTHSHISPSQGPKGLSLVLHGSSYPPTSSDSIPQSINLTLLCSTKTTEITFISYDGSELKMEWSAPSGCGMAPSEDESNQPDNHEPGQDEDVKESVGSGIGWFFLVLLLAFFAYFALGMYHNYSTYGATGKDLIPHRDFWREVPYMLRDVFDHLCTTFRPRHSSRGGYIAV